LDDEELAAEKILKVWKSLDNGELTRPCNWNKFKAYIKPQRSMRKTGREILRRLKRQHLPIEENHKFPPIDASDIKNRVSRLRHVLGIDQELECKLLSDRSILIRAQ